MKSVELDTIVVGDMFFFYPAGRFSSNFSGIIVDIIDSDKHVTIKIKNLSSCSDIAFTIDKKQVISDMYFVHGDRAT